MRLLFLSIGLMILCVSLSPAQDRKESKKLEGTWVPSEGELGSQKLPNEALKAIQLVIKDGKYTVTANNNTDKGDLKLDASKKPKAMDIIGTAGPNKGKTYEAIYELEGDSLRVCYALEGKRPAEFRTNGDMKIFLVMYKRQK